MVPKRGKGSPRLERVVNEDSVIVLSSDSDEENIGQQAKLPAEAKHLFMLPPVKLTSGETDAVRSEDIHTFLEQILAELFETRAESHPRQPRRFNAASVLEVTSFIGQKPSPRPEGKQYSPVILIIGETDPGPSEDIENKALLLSMSEIDALMRTVMQSDITEASSATPDNRTADTDRKPDVAEERTEDLVESNEIYLSRSVEDARGYQFEIQSIRQDLDDRTAERTEISEAAGAIRPRTENSIKIRNTTPHQVSLFEKRRRMKLFPDHMTAERAATAEEVPKVFDVPELDAEKVVEATKQTPVVEMETQTRTDRFVVPDLNELPESPDREVGLLQRTENQPEDEEDIAVAYKRRRKDSTTLKLSPVLRGTSIDMIVSHTYVIDEHSKPDFDCKPNVIASQMYSAHDFSGCLEGK